MSNISSRNPTEDSSTEPPETINRFTSYNEEIKEEMQEIDSEEEEEVEMEDPINAVVNDDAETELEETVKQLASLHPETPISRGQRKWYDRDPNWKWKGKPLPSPISKEKIRIAAITWNMEGRPPPDDISSLFPIDVKHHLYIVCAEECMRSIGHSLFKSSKKDWETKVLAALGREYSLVEACTLTALHLAIYAHISVKQLISFQESDKISTGVANVIGNKGGVGISFKIGSTKAMIIGCHLAAGHNSVTKRNNDLARIERELSLPSYWPKTGLASDRADFAIILGDLNYRIYGPKDCIEYLIEDNSIEVLKKYDQLRLVIEDKKVAKDFQEGEIKFPPTYRFDKGVNRYDTSKKQRIPGWTDRILYKDRKGLIKQKSYDCIMSEKHSDHRPVFSQFVLRFRIDNVGQSNVKTNKGSSTCITF